jgi:para-aminobenzoate synthetase/4-amino-4-deoxychorismate lyase
MLDLTDLLSTVIKNSETYALLEDSKSIPEKAKNLLFLHSHEAVIAMHEGEISHALERLETLKQEGFFLCGYLAYEAGYHFIDKIIPDTFQDEKGQPLLYFIAFKELHYPTRAELDALFSDKSLFPETALSIYELSLNTSKNSYIKNIQTIKKYIEAGDTYQINYTLKYNFKLQGDNALLYQALRQTQPVEFGALLNFPESKIISLSPELFVYKNEQTLTSKPMKGTAKRGKNKEEDDEIVEFLKNDSKTLSENVMIVDLIRNDFSRICEIGSVRVNDLFQVQTFKSIHQMISTVKGTLKKGLSFTHILKALFPCGSITGAPKIRTMEIINDLETEARGIYTGAIGYLMPNNDFHFNVPIRTIVIHDTDSKSTDKSCEMGIGSGIVYQSHANDEYEECLLKANFLRQVNKHFYLIEAFKFDVRKQQFNHIKQHLNRLMLSASYFGFELNRQEIESQLEHYKISLISDNTDHQSYKIRLTASQSGDIQLSHQLIEDKLEGVEKVLISDERVQSSMVFQYHKTSKREHYNNAYDKAQRSGFYDVLFFNESKQLAEASRHNVFIKVGGQYYTPPVSAGILDGIERQSFIQQKKAREKNLSLDDLLSADEVILTNSVRGAVSVTLSTS